MTTWGEADLISEDPKINNILRSLASRNMRVTALQTIKKVLESDDWSYEKLAMAKLKECCYISQSCI